MRSSHMKTLLRVILIVLGLAILLLILGTALFLIANRTNGVISSSGERRRYLLHVPASYDAAVPAPLVVSIHGFAEWPAHQQEISRWNDLADEYGFIVVYPSGTRFPLRWRTNSAPGTDFDRSIDVTFISDLIDHLAADYAIDPARVYVNGLSNGGGMSFALSCDLSERIAAIGSVSGAYLLSWEQCRPSRPVPAVVFHGTADPIVPFAGGPSHAFDIPFPAITQWVDELARRNGCGAAEELREGSEVLVIRYSGCDADVVFYTIEGGGHAWPGGGWLPPSIVGYTTQEIDATRLMWEFFEQHPLTFD